MLKRQHVFSIGLLLALAAGATAACSSSPTPTPSHATPTPISVAGPAPTLASPASPTPAGAGPPGLPPTLQLPDVVGVVERVGRAVVSIVADTGGGGVSSGSGVFFDAQGHILTNNHVIQGAERISVTLDDGQQYDARVVGADPFSDLAVLRIDGVIYPAVPFADPGSVRVGQWVIAIGNALALPGGPTVTVGIVSALDRSLQVQRGVTLNGLIQTDTIINPGNSGGPLLNLAGELVGINTAVLRGDRIEGIGFAVSSETAIPVSRALIENGRVRWAWLGVVIADLSAVEAMERGLGAGQGVLVIDVESDGPAGLAGIREDDVLVSISGRVVPTVRELSRVLRLEFRAGDAVEVEIRRGGQPQTLQVTLGERPPL